MNFDELDNYDIKRILVDVYEERKDRVQMAAAMYEADRHSTSLRNRMRELSYELRGIETVLDALGLDPIDF